MLNLRDTGFNGARLFPGMVHAGQGARGGNGLLRIARMSELQERAAELGLDDGRRNERIRYY